MERYQHPFFNPEIKPALVVINLFTGLLLPFILVVGILSSVAKSLQAFLTEDNIIQTLWIVMAGIGTPLVIIWSLFATWSYYKRELYKKAFFAAASPFLFAAFTIGSWIVISLFFSD
ncbi:MAG: hypothetical protein RMJ44_02155 [Cytophagales bacterium]|nr:hypothetical protein [Bernardetiaceae bacterium]MDW8209863.1 hypothetical protein [Cytophagales bacterium]